MCINFTSKNIHLEKLVNKYFLPSIDLDKPKIGIYSMKDLIGEFNYAVEEYSKIDNKVIEVYESKTTEELLVLHNINSNDFLKLEEYVNNYLYSHQDENIDNLKKQKIIFNQIEILLDETKRTISDIKDSDLSSSENKLTKVFYSSDVLEKKNYLNKVIELMKEAEVNQIENDKYLVLEKMFDENIKLMQLYRYVNSPKSPFGLKELRLKFKDMKKYLNSIKDDDIKLVKLKSYRNKLSTEHMYLFVWYIIYDMNKIDIYQINSIIGYRYNKIVKLYNYIFQLDHSTGRNKDFVHHTQIKYDDLTLYYLLNYLK